MAEWGAMPLPCVAARDGQHGDADEGGAGGGDDAAQEMMT